MNNTSFHIFKLRSVWKKLQWFCNRLKQQVRIQGLNFSPRKLKLLILGGVFSNAAFSQNFKNAEPLKELKTTNVLVPLLIDVDDDGDLDILGRSLNTSTFEFQHFTIVNEGDAEQFEFNEIDINTITFELSEQPFLYTDAGDLDGDGDLDLISVGYYDFFLARHVKYYENVNGAYADRGIISTIDPNSESRFSSDVSLGDIDMDGDLDLIFFGTDPLSVNYSLRAINLYYIENTGTPSNHEFLDINLNQNPFGFTQFQSPTLLYATHQIETGDFDNDGDLDVLYIPNQTFNYSTIMLYTENVDGVFNNPRQISGIFGFSGLTHTTSGDLDNDGDLDLLFEAENTNPDDEHSNLFWLENKALGTTSVHHNTFTEPQISYNSARQSVHIKLDEPQSNLLAIVTNHLGQKLLNQSITNKREFFFPVHSLPLGSYFLILMNEEINYSKGFVKTNE